MTTPKYKGGIAMKLPASSIYTDKENESLPTTSRSPIDSTSPITTGSCVNSIKSRQHGPLDATVEDPFYCVSNQLHLEQSIQQLRNGKGTVHELIEDYND